MTELGLFQVFYLRKRGWGQGWGQNQGQFGLENIKFYFYVKFQGPTLKIDWVRTILSQNQGQGWLGNIYIYFHLKFEGTSISASMQNSSLKNDWIRSIISFWPPK